MGEVGFLAMERFLLAAPRGARSGEMTAVQPRE